MMKLTTNLVRIIVGVLFIFSGLVKANDPLGLSYKMQEFFEVWGVSRLDPTTLASSVIMNAFEIIAGFALLLGWRIRLFSWLLLALIVFFTFLTGYTFITGKPTNCGCFGDCLPISSRTSFLKDVALTVLIAFICWQRKYIQPLFAAKLNTILMVLVIIFSFGFQWYTLRYLPVVDCLPYKKGNNITDLRKVPANAIPDSSVILFVYKKGNEEVRFTAENFPADFSDSLYTYVDREDKLIRAGINNHPPIKDFVLNTETGADTTEAILAEPRVVLLFVQTAKDAASGWQKKFEPVYRAAVQSNVPVHLVTGTRADLEKAIQGTPLQGASVLTCDNTAIRTAARTNPCLYVVEKGTILGKWAAPNMSSALPLLEKK